MATVFKIGEDWDMPPPPTGFPKCGNFNGNELVSFLYPEDIESLHANLNESVYSILDTRNDSHINMVSTLGKLWPFVGGAHPYVSSLATINSSYFSIVLCIVISLLFIN